MLLQRHHRPRPLVGQALASPAVTTSMSVAAAMPAAAAATTAGERRRGAPVVGSMGVADAGGEGPRRGAPAVGRGGHSGERLLGEGTDGEERADGGWEEVGGRKIKT
jgi:hypothetical protein